MKLIAVTMIFVSFLGLSGNRSDTDPSNWSNKKTEKWFSKNEWAGGWKVSADASVNKKEFAIAYFKNKPRWEKAFKFLKDNDLSKLELKRYDIDGDNLYATVSEYTTKNEETTNFEAHKRYIDIQYVIKGKEIMNIAPIETIKDVITPYDETKDIEFVTVAKKVNYAASQDNFFIFFPDDAHRPGLKVDVNLPVRKIVIKLKVN